MSLFAAKALVALLTDHKRHGENFPFLLSITALSVIMGALYLFYHNAIFAAGYVLLLIVAFLSQNRMLAFLNRAVEAQAATLTDVNASLEGRVSERVEKMGRLARLKRFLPGEITDLITSEGNESLLESQRVYIS